MIVEDPPLQGALLTAMIVDTIESRYTVDPGTLERYLEAKFGKGNFSIIVSPPPSTCTESPHSTDSQRRCQTKERARNGNIKGRGSWYL
jgi:hypothetical protein